LLTRPTVQLDVEACTAALAGKRVLITGAAGSIGAELTRQVLAVNPESVVAVDTNETGLYELEGDLSSLADASPLSSDGDSEPLPPGTRPDHKPPKNHLRSSRGAKRSRVFPVVRVCIADISDARRIRELFDVERPQVVFHAAAYKH